eukprot:GGOE01061417.1.p1 GENE.GGOE01061417.1~~GGOE01061417.1.p1  ORF type:complete len:335 (-),score=-11.59 GGOE01061417.1:123-1001(-)
MTYRGFRCTVWDFPGTGDVTAEGHQPLTNNDVFEMILKVAYDERVVKIVFMVDQTEFSSARHNQHTLELARTLFWRFHNVPSIVHYCISGSDILLSETFARTLYERRKNKFESLGLHAGNWSICAEHDFEVPKRKCLQAVARASPEFLQTTGYRMQCQICKVIADPLVVSVKTCHFHGEPGEPLHSPNKFPYHPQPVEMYHPDVYQGCWGYKCCGLGHNSRGCKCGHICCRGEHDGCEQKCCTCLRDVKELGCLGTCAACSRPTSTVGCLSKPSHEWGTIPAEGRCGNSDHM